MEAHASHAHVWCCRLPLDALVPIPFVLRPRSGASTEPSSAGVLCRNGGNALNPGPPLTLGSWAGKGREEWPPSVSMLPIASGEPALGGRH